ncbi:Macro domain [Macleaya cordata]|uniref:Macro domain n=1 Tax=Macleaya cordata TaxID=56857 RepID=A0A200R3I4_MACCD|nr:Macro domain [Macleaya cordata]
MMTRTKCSSLFCGGGAQILRTLPNRNPRFLLYVRDFVCPNNNNNSSNTLLRTFRTSSLITTTKRGIGVGLWSSSSIAAAAAGRDISMTSNGGGDDRRRIVHFSLSSSSSLKIQQGDITKWFVDGASDAIGLFSWTVKLGLLSAPSWVNAANERMLGGGGVDGAIHRAAGPELRSACYAVPEVRPGVRCPKGEARITPAFRLPVSHVIHTVGPIYDVDNHPEVTLKSAYRNCLRLAKDNNIQYIAFPAISCGVYGYPYEEAATIAISTAMESAGEFKEVHFVLFQDDVFNAWLEKAKELL